VTAQTLLIVAVCVAIVLVGGGVIASNAARRRRSAAAQMGGLKVPGRIVAVNRQTYLDRTERTRFHVQIKLQFFDPDIGREVTTFYVLQRHTKNMPPQISGPGAGVTDLAAVAARHREMQTFREQLASQGHSADQIKQAVMGRAIALANEGPTEVDSDGYLTFKTPVVVDVYLSSDKSGGERGIHVVF
jgi:hypothetical protein